MHATIYRDHHVQVTESVLTIGGHNYPVAGITAFRTVRQAPNDAGHLLAMVFGGLVAVGGFGALFIPQAAATGAVLLLAGAGAAILGWHLRRGLSPVFHLVLSTAGGDLHALTSSSHHDVDRVSRALTEALAARYR